MHTKFVIRSAYAAPKNSLRRPASIGRRRPTAGRRRPRSATAPRPSEPRRATRNPGLAAGRTCTDRGRGRSSGNGLRLVAAATSADATAQARARAMCQTRRMPKQLPPHGAIAHVAINADDVSSSRAFYEQLFGWRFTPWGPPGFYQIETPGAPAPRAALQQRRELVSGVRTVGFECTIAVDDVHATLRTAATLGGRIVMEPVVIPTVCELAFIEDPSGNVLGIARYAEP